ncbi:phage tail protein [Nostoc ellipsosporum NOK]|nr:phage tail protein [Nostoc ellipsosporum NOK]
MEGTVGEIRMFAGNFAPRNWAFCQGQIVPLQSNVALFAIVGTIYGGNGTSNFALPNLSGRTPVGVGQGPGLSSYQIGQIGGTENKTLTSLNLPAHTHPVSGSITMPANTTLGNQDGPQSNYPAFFTDTEAYNTASNGTMGAMKVSPFVVAQAGSSAAYSSRQPVLGINYIICMFGVFPARN